MPINIPSVPASLGSRELTETARDERNATAVHTHSPSDIAGLAEVIQDILAAAIVGGTNVTAYYDDAAGTLTISAAGAGGGGLTLEEIQDAVAAMFIDSASVTKQYNDTNGTIQLSAVGAGNGAGLTLEEVQDAVAAMFLNTATVTKNYDDGAGTIQLTAVSNVASENSLFSLYGNSLSLAVSQIGSTKTTLLIERDTTISTSVTVPANLELRFSNQARIIKAGSGAINFQGIGLVGLTNMPVFSGFAAGNITWTGTVFPSEIRAEIFGGADWSANVNLATNAFIGKQVKIVAGAGTLTSLVTLRQYHHLHQIGRMDNTATFQPQILLEDDTEVTCGTNGVFYTSNQVLQVRFMYATQANIYPYTGQNKNINIRKCKIKGYNNLGLPLDTAASAIFLGNTDGFEITDNWVDHTQGFGIYVGAFGDAGFTAENGTIARNRCTNLGSQNIGMISGRRVKVHDNLCHKLGQVVREYADASVSSGVNTVNVPSGSFAAHHVGYLIEIVPPSGENYYSSINAILSPTSIQLSTAYPLPAFTASGRRFRILSPFVSAYDWEPNGVADVIENSEFERNTVDWTDANCQYGNSFVLQVGGGKHVRNCKLANNVAIGGEESNAIYYRKNSNGFVIDGANNCTIENNTAIGCGQQGMSLNNSAGLKVRGNTLKMVGGGGNVGMLVKGVSKSMIEDNHLIEARNPISQDTIIKELEAQTRITVVGAAITRTAGALFYEWWVGQTVKIASIDLTVTAVNPNTTNLTLSAPVALPPAKTATANTTSNQFTTATHNFSTGLVVRFTSTGTLPAPLQPDTDYFVAIISGTIFMIATSFNNATVDGVFIDITTVGTGVHTVTPVAYIMETRFSSNTYRLNTCAEVQMATESASVLEEYR